MIVRTQLSWYNIVQTLPFNCTNIVWTEMSIVRTVVRTLYQHCMNKVEQMQDRVLLWFGLPTLITKPIGVVFTKYLKMYIWLFLLPLEKMTSISTCLLFYDKSLVSEISSPPLVWRRWRSAIPRGSSTWRSHRRNGRLGFWFLFRTFSTYQTKSSWLLRAPT